MEPLRETKEQDRAQLSVDACVQLSRFVEAFEDRNGVVEFCEVQDV